MQAEILNEGVWSRLSELIARATGLEFTPHRRGDLERSLAAAAAELDFTTLAAYADWLLSTTLTRPQLNALASHLTVGETYFLRESRTLDALAQRILPDLIQERRGRDQRLSLWSAACCTGEEAYSLAILVRHLLPDWKDWKVTILGTDINERYLRKARAGVYGEWSFRETPASFKESYFKRSAKALFSLRREIQSCVTFEQLNLAADGFPSTAHGMDVILCRNVLMYFSPSKARHVVDKLRASLAEDGWLAVSPGECSQSLFADFSAVNFPDAILYHKARATNPTGERIPAPEEAPAPLADDAAAALAAPPTPMPLPPSPTMDSASPPPVAPANPGARARKLANEGNLPEALDWSRRWVAADKLNSAAYYLQAMIQQESGDYDAARRSLRRAVYLQPGFALAHFALGNLARRSARGGDADQHFRNALRCLDRQAPGEPLPESEGLTAGRLREIIASLTRPAPSSRPAIDGSLHDVRR